MAYRFETLNRGVVEGGVFFGDNELIRLGDLPAMPVVQFIKYSSDTIAKLLSSEDITQRDKQRFISIVSFACGRLSQSYLDSISPNEVDKKGKLLAGIVRQHAPIVAKETGRVGMDYPTNPFVLNNGKIIIKNFYELEPEDFVYFVGHIFGGGSFGWNPNFTPSFEQIKPLILDLQDRLEGIGKYKE